MAPNATNHHFPGRTGRLIHALFPSRRKAGFILAVDIAAWLLGLPLPVHLIVALAILWVPETRSRR
jgi:hypothetical protein